MNKNTTNTELFLRALGLIVLLLVILARLTSVFGTLLQQEGLLYMVIAAAVLLGAAYYLRNKRLHAENREDIE